MGKNYLENKLADYCAGEDYPFHMPGHKRNRDIFLTGTADGENTAGPSIGPVLAAMASCDITEIPGFDDLHDPEGILYREMRFARRFYGTKDTIFSVNGSTAAILAAVSASAPRGSKVLTAANCHRAVEHAMTVRGLLNMVLFTDPAPYGSEWLRDGGPVEPEAVERAFAKAPDLKCVVITSPTYDGIVSDVAALADVVHAHGAVLIVDEAHGAHFSLHPSFPVSAVKLGADLVIQSLHKTLPSLTQTALLHNATGRVSSVRLMEWMDVYETSSPSYLLLSSITNCVHTLKEGGPALFDPYVERLAAFRKEAEEWKKLRLLRTDDPSKLLIGTGDSGLSGKKLAALLRNKYHIVTELDRADYVLAMTSVADTGEGFARLGRALALIDSGER